MRAGEDSIFSIVQILYENLKPAGLISERKGDEAVFDAARIVNRVEIRTALSELQNYDKTTNNTLTDIYPYKI